MTPTRLIVEVGNPGEMRISPNTLKTMAMRWKPDKLDAEKTTYFLEDVIVLMVMVIGLVISVLSFYPDAQHLPFGTEELLQVERTSCS